MLNPPIRVQKPREAHPPRSPHIRLAADRGVAILVTNPYSENKESDSEDEDYTFVLLSDDTASKGGEEEATLVPGAVQHIPQTGYPSHRGKGSLDTDERPNKEKKKKKKKFPNPNPNPTPTKAQLIAEPITHTLYFKVKEMFDQPKVTQDRGASHLGLHTLGVSLHTPSGRRLTYKETEALQQKHFV